MTYEEFIQQVSQLEVDRQYSYLPSATSSSQNTYTLLSVSENEIKVLRDEKETLVSISQIKKILDVLKEAEPLDVESALGGSGNTRSIVESLLCLTSSIFFTRVHNRKHIVLLSSKKHPLGSLEYINESELDEIIKREKEQNRKKVEEEFKHYLSNTARSKKTGKKLGPSSISSYLIFIKCDKLFDYNPTKWKQIESVYDISSLDEISKVLNTLLNDPEFIERNKKDNNGFRSRALKQYQNFLISKLTSANKEEFDDDDEVSTTGICMLLQQIFFGAPGTGKSHKIDYDLFKDENGNPIGMGIKEVPEVRKFRTTFHPDYDYAQFVGAYKPKVDEKSPDKKIIYSFVPQVFAKAYAKAWKLFIGEGGKSTSENQTYLVIEEINRGNCAQIFGDLFQLLDRDASDASQYSIDADYDFAKWLEEEFQTEKVWDAYKKEVNGEGKLKLPPNLNILATMNTSDQSLFPMDSAFKRRFDWEYVPINYDQSKADFEIKIDDSEKYKWLDFLEKVNADIYKATRSEDKQMGEFFIKPKDDKTIRFEDFRSKVLFYLWDSVYKDEIERKLVFHFEYGEGADKIDDVTFQSLFGKDAKEIVNKIMENLKVEKVTAT